MLRYTTDRARPGLGPSRLVYTTSGQETERVNSYNPGARTGLTATSMTSDKLSNGRRIEVES